MNGTLKVGSWVRANAANLVTVSRLIMAFWLIYLAIDMSEESTLMLVLAGLCAGTDWLDGFLARKLGITSPVGGVLDWIADKVFICSLVIFIAWGNPLGDTPAWLRTATKGVVVAMLLFEGIFVIGGAWRALTHKHISSNQHGKRKMALESTAVLFWFACLVAHRHGIVSMLVPLIITNFLFVLTIFAALKSMQGYYKEYFQDKASG